jgi:hypothetical protein
MWNMRMRSRLDGRYAAIRDFRYTRRDTQTRLYSYRVQDIHPLRIHRVSRLPQIFGVSSLFVGRTASTVRGTRSGRSPVKSRLIFET